MTGYGRATVQSPVGRITVELRSTNHRYLEIEARLPNGLAVLQGRLTELLRAHLRRGRVEVALAVQANRADRRRVTFDEPLLRRYHEALVELKARFGVKGAVTLDHLLALPQALTVSEDRLPAERLWDALRRAVELAARELIRARQREGAKLTADVRRQLQAIEQHVRAIKQQRPKALEQQRQHLRQRLLDLLGPGSAGSAAQLEQAVALAKDADIHEELVRLDSHLGYLRQTLAGPPLVGKRLDFIAQELMREANTLGAKVDDPRATHHVVDIKGCIEKIREQVQNLE
jgi:uncharacterized protein (TIGR00255 family)